MSRELRETAESLRRDVDAGFDVAGSPGQADRACRILTGVAVLACAYLAEHPVDDDEPVTEAWLRQVGFLPNGDDLAEFGIRLWSIGETDDYGEHPAMHFLWSMVDNSSWLEAYGTGGESLCIVELATKNSRGGIRRLCKQLGIILNEGAK